MPATHMVTGAGVFTPEGYAEALEAFGESINPAVRRGMWRSAKIVRAIFIARFASRGVGRAVFGKNKSGAYKQVKIDVAGPVGGVFVMQLKLTGYPALQERGGHTLPHDIKPKLKHGLKLKVPSIGQVIRKVVHHPGSNMWVDPSGPRAFEQAAPRIRLAINDAITEFRWRGVRIVA